MERQPKQKTVSLSITNSNKNRLRKSRNTEVLEQEVSEVVRQASIGNFNVLSLYVYNSSTLNLTAVPIKDMTTQEFIDMLVIQFEKHAIKLGKDIRLLEKITKQYPHLVVDDVYQLVVTNTQSVAYMIPLEYTKQNKKVFDILDTYSSVYEVKFSWICSIIEEETGMKLKDEIGKFALKLEKCYKIHKVIFLKE